MSSETKFGALRRILRVLGLSQQATDDVVDFIVDLLAGEDKNGADKARAPEFPYHLRDHFLTPAELSFFSVLRTVVGTRVTLCTKVALSDVFWVKNDDPSRFRVYTNKIDRKHVDFLLCDPATMRPLVGIELDDKSHQRQDRQERDAFVDQVFKAAGLALLHVSAKRGYSANDIAAQLAPFLSPTLEPEPTATEVVKTRPAPAPTSDAPQCPKCGSAMVLRTARSGANAGNRFWGCSNYPACRSILPYGD